MCIEELIELRGTQKAISRILDGDILTTPKNLIDDIDNLHPNLSVRGRLNDYP